MAAPAPAPLLLTCALGIERLALRGALGRAVVLRTGAGAPAARQAVAGVLRGGSRFLLEAPITSLPALS